MIKEFLSRWPVIRQIRNHSDGTGPDAMTERARQLRPRTADAEVVRSVCPLSFAKTLRGHKSRRVTMLQDHPHAIHFKHIPYFGE